MRRPLTIVERRFPPLGVNDQRSVAIEANERDAKSKVDRRNVVSYTFNSTNLEAIEHKLGRLPIGASVVYQSAAAQISGDKSLWTSRKLYMRSSVAGVEVSLQLI